MSTITEANQRTTREDVTFASVGVKPHRAGAPRVPDNLTAWTLTANSDGFTWLCMSDSKRSYRMDKATARRFCTAILEALDGDQ